MVTKRTHLCIPDGLDLPPRVNRHDRKRRDRSFDKFKQQVAVCQDQGHLQSETGIIFQDQDANYCLRFLCQRCHLPVERPLDPDELAAHDLLEFEDC